MATTTPRTAVEQCTTFVPDSPRAPGLCATCGDSQPWHRDAYRSGQLAEQRHAFLDLDPDSACRPAGFVCPNACPAPELEATA